MISKYKLRSHEVEALRWDGKEETVDRFLEWTGYNSSNSQIFSDGRFKLGPVLSLNMGDYLVKRAGGFVVRNNEDFQNLYESV